MSALHPFERAGLGRAPFRCTAVRTNWFEMPGFGRKPGGCCDYCYTGILYEYVIESSDGKAFVVGSDCVRRTGASVEGFREARLRLARDKRETKRREKFAERQARWAKEREERAAVFNSANAEIVAWLDAARAGNYFLEQLWGNLQRWGSLTERQTLALYGARDRAERQKRDRELSQHVGTVGKRIEGTFEVIATKSWESSYGWPRKMVYWTLLRFGDNLCTYKGNFLGQRGDKIRAKFTVKEHEVYGGARQTKLSRPKVEVEPEACHDEREPRDEPTDHSYNNLDRADRYGAREVSL